MLTLDSKCRHIQGEGLAQVGIGHFPADKGHLGEQGAGGIAGLQGGIIVIITVCIGPVGFVDVQVDAVVSGQRRVIDAGGQPDAQVHGVAAGVLHTDGLADYIAGKDHHRLRGEGGAVSAGLQQLKADAAGGDYISGLLGGGIVGIGAK